MEHWAKGLFVGFLKDDLLAELQTRMSRGCRFLLFLKHKCLGLYGYNTVPREIIHYPGQGLKIQGD